METADSVKPSVTAGVIDYGTGMLTLTLSELCAVGYVKLACIAQTAGATGANTMALTAGATAAFFSIQDQVVFTLTEVQCVAAIRISGTPGGDGTTVVLFVLASASMSAAGSAIAVTQG